MRYIYPMLMNADEGEFYLTFPQFPECHSRAETAQEAQIMGLDCLMTAMANRIDDRQDIPKPRAPRAGEVSITLPLIVAAKLAAYHAMRDQNIGNMELARRLEVNYKSINRMLDLYHSSKIEHIQRALAALGRDVAVDVKAA